MRLSGPIKNKPAANVPLPVKKERDAPAAAPPAYSADLPAPAIVPTSQRVGTKVGAAWATKAGSKITQPAPSAKNGGFSMSALIKEKNITPARDTAPVKPMEQEPAVAEMPAQATDAPVIFTPQKTVPVTVNAPPVPPDRRKHTAEIGQDGTGAPTPPGKTLHMFDPMTKPVSPAPVPPANISAKQAEAVAEAPPRIMESTPLLAEANAPAAANASRYVETSTGICEVCKQLGIAVPSDRTAIIEQARMCLVTVFKKILLPASEQYMIWPMIKSIASDLDGIIDTDASILNILHRHRVKEEKLVWHSLYVAILAMDLARHEENLDGSAYEIGGAALLHDAGFLLKTAHGFDTDGFDEIVDEKPPEFYEHVGKSVELARRMEAPDAVVTMIAQHHGRINGHGFPPGLSRSTFLRSSQILAIANTFEHAILDLSMETKGTMPKDNIGENGIINIFREYRKAFDVDLLKKMIALVGFYPVGCMVELNNRAIGKVVKQNNNFPLRPVVEIVMDGTGMHPEEEKLIDLNEIKVLSILRTIAKFERKIKQE